MIAKSRTLQWRARGSELGATAVEYALLIALIAAVIVGAVITIGAETGAVFQNFCDALATATRGGTC